MRTFFIFLLSSLLQIVGSAAAPAQWYNIPLIPRWQAEQHELKRAWFTQVPLDRARSRITSLTMHSGAIMAVTDEAMLYVIDAESGLIQWSYQTGDPRFVTLAAGANSTCVAVVNGATLSVLDRASGAIVFRRELGGVPERGAILNEKHVAVPMVLGPLETYPLDVAPEKVFFPHYLAAGGRIVGFPVGFGDNFAWANDKSQLRGYQFAESGLDFSARVPGGTSTGVEAFPPYLYVGTESGYVVAYDRQRGGEIWEFPAGSPIRRRPISVGTAVYVYPMDGGMFALAPDTGQQKWYARDPARFVSATPDRIYSLDRFGWLVMNDAKTGARLDAMWLPHDVKSLINNQTDRMVLYTDDGLIQCLHEIQREQPLIYAPPKPKPKAAPPGATQPAAETPGSPGNPAPGN